MTDEVPTPEVLVELAADAGFPPDPRGPAREEARRLRAEHMPEPLPEDVDHELMRIIEARTAEG